MKAKTALLSVFNKEPRDGSMGITAFASSLIDHGWDILASGGTARYLNNAGIKVTDVAQLIRRSMTKVLLSALRNNKVSIKHSVLGPVFADIGEPILGHRVVTLSREVHAAILARTIEEDETELERLGLPKIGLVCVDMYPLQDKLADTDAIHDDIVETTDIGGPTMLYAAAAKGGQIVVCDPTDRQRVITWMNDGCPDKFVFIDDLAINALKTVRDYVNLSFQYRVQRCKDLQRGL